MGGLSALALATLAGRLFQLQVLDAEQHRSRAEENRIRMARSPAPRGLIVDRNRLPIVRNRPSFTVSILPADLPRRPDVVFRRLVKLIGGSPSEFARALARASDDPFTPVPLRSTFDPTVVHAIEQRASELPGVLVQTIPVREYVDGPITSHLVGHVGPIDADQYRASGAKDGPYAPTDRVGQAGVELALEEQLRGTAGRRRLEVDAAGREVGLLGVESPRPGNNVALTIDLALQREVHRILADRIAQFEVASAVVVNPNDGAVLALAHLPAYENSLFSDGMGDDDFARLMKDPARPMLNGAIASTWPPGSTFKVITALAALESGVVKPETKIHCGGGIRLPGGAFLGCWTAHGQQDMVSALATSCDTYFYHVVGGEPFGRWAGIGPDVLADWARHFGLGKPTGLELPAEAPGIVPTPAWKRSARKEPWYAGDSYISAIGQGFYTTTPLQMAMVAATLANGGTMFGPRLVSEVSDGRGKAISHPEPRMLGRLPASEANIRLVREGTRAGMMIGTSPFGTRFYGTSWDSDIKELPMAGKTGTSEYGVKGPDGKLPTHGWFIFWAPHEAPKIAGAVFVKRGRGAQEAAKVGARIVRSYFGIV